MGTPTHKIELPENNFYARDIANLKNLHRVFKQRELDQASKKPYDPEAPICEAKKSQRSHETSDYEEDGTLFSLPNFYHKDLTRLLSDFDQKISKSSTNKQDQMQKVVRKMQYQS